MAGFGGLVVPAAGLGQFRGGQIREQDPEVDRAVATVAMRAICLWTVNPRWRDYADITLLSAAHDVAGDELAASIQIVAAYRNVALSPLDEALAGYVEIAQGKWSAFGAGGG